MSCGVGAIVLSQRQCSFFDRLCLHQRLQLKQKRKTKNGQKTAGTETCVQDGPVLPAIFCDVIMSATSAWSSLLCTCSIGGTGQRAKLRNKTHLAPKRDSLGVLWTYSGSVVVLSWDLIHNENTQTSTQTHACRATLTLARSTQTRGGSPRPRIKHTPLHKDWHKSDKNLPVNLAKTATAALPFLY